MINHVLLHRSGKPNESGLLFDWLRWWLHRRFTLAFSIAAPLTRQDGHNMKLLKFEFRISNFEFVTRPALLSARESVP
jgi:hypothetical protein